MEEPYNNLEDMKKEICLVVLQRINLPIDRGLWPRHPIKFVKPRGTLALP